MVGEDKKVLDKTTRLLQKSFINGRLNKFYIEVLSLHIDLLKYVECQYKDTENLNRKYELINDSLNKIIKNW